MQNPAVPVVVNLNRGIDAAGDHKVNFVAVGFGGGDFYCLLGFEVVVEADFEGFGSVEVQGFSGFAFSELEGEDAHADKVTAVDAFVAGGDDGFDV